MPTCRACQAKDQELQFLRQLVTTLTERAVPTWNRDLPDSYQLTRDGEPLLANGIHPDWYTPDTAHEDSHEDSAG